MILVRYYIENVLFDKREVSGFQRNNIIKECQHMAMAYPEEYKLVFNRISVGGKLSSIFLINIIAKTKVIYSF